MQRQVFSESEASQIIERAVQLQQADASYTPGVTWDELVRVAKEVGISEEVLRKAVAAPVDTSTPKFFNLAETFDRVFEGELSRDGLESVIETLRTRFKIQGGNLGKGAEMQVRSGLTFGRSSLSCRKGRTRFTFHQIPFVAYFIGLHGPLILGVVLGAQLLSHGQLAAGLACLLGVPAAGLLAFRTLALKGRQRARELFDMVCEEIEANLQQDSPSEPSAEQDKDSER